MKVSLILTKALVIFTLFSCNQSGNSQTSGSAATVVNIDASKLIELAKDSNTIIVDVRTPGEVAEGYIPGTKVFLDYNGGQFDQSYKSLDTTKTYIVYCRSGRRSSSAANQMVNSGFKKVYNLDGGINAWTGDLKKD